MAADITGQRNLKEGAGTTPANDGGYHAVL